MEKAILGKKLGMMQIFDETGLAVPATVVEAGPLVVVGKKVKGKDTHDAIVCGFEDVEERKLARPIAGQMKKAGVPLKRVLREFRFDDCAKYNVGDVIKCDIFAAGDVVDVVGVTKGRGFTGAIKRWNQHRLKMTHGTGPVHRERGSTGANSTPSKVIKGLHMAGHYGHERVTIKNLKIVRVDAERNILLIKGAIPGPKGGLVTVKEAVKR